MIDIIMFISFFGGSCESSLSAFESC